jgi:iron complex transport system ATP-binding protein
MVVELENVSWRREQRLILDQIDWQINKGEHWCLVGLNGSGKTSILDLINGYHWSTTGKITVLGKKFGETDLRELRKEIGWVSTSMQQRLHAYEMVENIIISGKFASVGIYEQTEKQDYEFVQQLLAAWKAEHLYGRIYQTLSQGEKQKVLIGRALMAKPKLLILDEPCTGLDIFAREQVLHMIEQIANDPDAPTLIYVTHHIEEILPCFTHTLLLKRGRIAEKGRSSDVLTEANLRDFFETSLTVERKNGRNWLMLT